MPPEQARGSMEDLDERSDIYALGGILYSILTLRPPVDGATPEEVLSKVTSGSIIAPSDLKTTFRGKRQPFEKGEVIDAQLIKPLPHLRGGRVPVALSSVAMKALHLEKDGRYQNVRGMSTEIEAYQGGRATDAEEAGAWKLLWLLMFRHRTFTASIVVLLLTSLGFVWKVVASERRAQASAAKSERSLAKAQLLLADTAFANGSPDAMAAALDSIPESLRDDRWNYYSSRRDTSLGPLKIDGFWQEVEDVAPVPHQPGQFAIACRNGKIGIVDVVSRKLLRTLDTEDAGDIRIATSGDGTRLLSRTGIAGRFHLFNTATGEKLITGKLGFYKFKPTAIFDQPIALNEDGTLAAFSFPARKEIRLFNMEKGTLVWTRIAQARQMLFHPDGKRLIVARPDLPALEILDVTDGQVMPGYGTTSGAISPQSLSLGSNGKWLAASLLNGELVMVNMDNKARLVRKVSNSPVGQIAFTAADNLLTLDAYGTGEAIDRSMEFFEPTRGNHMGTFLGLKNYPGYLPLRINRDSNHLLTIQSPPQLWQFPDKPLAKVPVKGEFGFSCAFLSDSDLLARYDTRLDFYDLSDPQTPKALDASLAPGHGIAATHPESRLFATAAFGKGTPNGGDAVRLLQFTDSGVEEKWTIPRSTANEQTMDLRFDAKGERLVRVSRFFEVVDPKTGENWTNVTQMANRGFVEILSVATGESLAQLPQVAYKAAFAGKDGCIITIDVPSADESPGELRLIEPLTGEVRASLKMPFGFHAISVSPDNQSIAVAGNSDFVMILDANTLKEKHRFFAHDKWISALSFHPTKPLLATGSADKRVKIWDAESGQLKQTCLGLQGYPLHLAFSPSGRLLAETGMENDLRIFEVEEDGN